MIKPGRILFEMEGVPESKRGARSSWPAAKLPIKTRFATRFAEEKAS